MVGERKIRTEAESMTTASPLVLIVDDEAMVRDLYRLGLERAGHRVIEAADGMAGLQIATTARPDVILLDVRMPRMDGIEMLRRLKADAATRDVPVVMLTNFDEPALVRESLGLGAYGYLLKVGTDPRDLAAVVAKVLTGAELDSLRISN
jgi:CheY-like chemotaxis protein